MKLQKTEIECSALAPRCADEAARIYDVLIDYLQPLMAQMSWLSVNLLAWSVEAVGTGAEPESHACDVYRAVTRWICKYPSARDQTLDELLTHWSEICADYQYDQDTLDDLIDSLYAYGYEAETWNDHVDAREELYDIYSRLVWRVEWFKAVVQRRARASYAPHTDILTCIRNQIPEWCLDAIRLERCSRHNRH